MTKGKNDQTWAWEDVAGGGAHSILSATHDDTVVVAKSRGAVLRVNLTPAWELLAHPGLAGRVLKTDALDVVYAVLAHSELGSIGANDHHAQLHKAAHVSGGGDAFVSTDLVDGVVRRIRESTGPTDLLVGSVADGQYLLRSGTGIIGGTPGAPPTETPLVKYVHTFAGANDRIRYQACVDSFAAGDRKVVVFVAGKGTGTGGIYVWDGTEATIPSNCEIKSADGLAYIQGPSATTVARMFKNSDQTLGNTDIYVHDIEIDGNSAFGGATGASVGFHFIKMTRLKFHDIVGRQFRRSDATYGNYLCLTGRTVAEAAGVLNCDIRRVKQYDCRWPMNFGMTDSYAEDVEFYGYAGIGLQPGVSFFFTRSVAKRFWVDGVGEMDYGYNANESTDSNFFGLNGKNCVGENLMINRNSARCVVYDSVYFQDVSIPGNQAFVFGRDLSGPVSNSGFVGCGVLASGPAVGQPDGFVWQSGVGGGSSDCWIENCWTVDAGSPVFIPASAQVVRPAVLGVTFIGSSDVDGSIQNTDTRVQGIMRVNDTSTNFNTLMSPFRFRLITPTLPSEGYIGWDTTAKRLKLHNNTTVKSVAWTDDSMTPSAHVLDGALHTITGKTAGQYLRATGATTFAFEAVPISVGGVVISPSGTINVIVWRAPFACTVTNVRGYRVGGTGATVNARKNGTLNHLASDLSMTSADTWQDGGAVQNAAYAAGDKMEIMVVSITGGPTQVAIQVDLTRP